MALTKLQTEGITDNAVTTEKIADGAVTTSDILDGTVGAADVSADVLESGISYAIVFG
jgi:hypothetical protein